MTCKMSSPRHKAPVVFWLCLALGGAAVICSCLFLAAPLTPRGGSTELTAVNEEGAPTGEAWDVYVVEDGKMRDLTSEGWNTYVGLSYEGQTFYASCMLRASYESAMLEMLAPFPVALFLDDDLLYADATAGSAQIGSVEFLPAGPLRAGTLLVSLPPDYAGRRLTVAQAQDYGGEEPILDVYIPTTTLLSETYYNSERLAEGADVFYPGVALLIAGILLLIMLAADAYSGERIAAPALLGSFCLLWMVYLYLTSIPLQMLEYYDALQPFTAVFYYGSTTCLALFMAVHMQGWLRRVLSVLAFVPAAVSAVVAALMQGGGASLDLVDLPDFIGFAVLAAAIVFAFLQAREVAFYKVFVRLFAAAAAVFALLILIERGLDSMWFPELGAPAVTLTYLNSLIRALLIVVCFADLVFEFMRQALARRSRLVLSEERVRLAETSLQQFRQQARETAMLQHDICRHLSVVGQHLQQDQVGKALDYLEQIGLQLESVPKTARTGSAPVDMILNSKLREMRELGIRTDVLAEELPQNLPLTEAETASLLLNTLDNAIRAAQAADPEELMLRIYARNGFLYYSCRNTTSRDKAAPKQGSRHGYGLQIVRQIVERWDGIVQIRQGAGFFQITCVLPLLSPATETK